MSKPGEENHDSIYNNLDTELSFLLKMASVGDRVWIVKIKDKAVTNSILAMGLVPGTEIEIISYTPTGSLLVSIGDKRIGIDVSMAGKIMVTRQSPGDQNREERQISVKKRTLADLQVNQKGQVAQYRNIDNKNQRRYRRKLLAMGLTPGTQFKVISVAPQGEHVEIELQNFNTILHMTILKEEAELLYVKEMM